jgi:hypothetical protein
MITFNEFLNTSAEDSHKIFEFYLDFLGEFSGKDFPFDEQLKLKGAGGKFLSSIDSTTYIGKDSKEQYIALLDKFQNEFKLYRRRIGKPILFRFLYPISDKTRLYRLQDTFQELYSTTLELINEATNKTYYFDDLKVNNFFKPDNSNKQKIKDLINEAIILIREDGTLTEKSKKSIIDYLERAISELERERVNWTRFIGRIKETIIVLGALGSFAGGASSLFQAQKKLEQTTVIIQKASVNFNFNVLNETFNVQNIRHIGLINNLLELPENKDIQDAEEVDLGEEKITKHNK